MGFPVPALATRPRLWAPGALLQRPTGLAPRRSAVFLDVLAAFLQQLLPVAFRQSTGVLGSGGIVDVVCPSSMVLCSAVAPGPEVAIASALG